MKKLFSFSIGFIYSQLKWENRERKKSWNFPFHWFKYRIDIKGGIKKPEYFFFSLSPRSGEIKTTTKNNDDDEKKESNRRI